MPGSSTTSRTMGNRSSGQTPSRRSPKSAMIMTLCTSPLRKAASELESLRHITLGNGGQSQSLAEETGVASGTQPGKGTDFRYRTAYIGDNDVGMFHSSCGFSYYFGYMTCGDYPPDIGGNNTKLSPSATGASGLDLRPLIRDTCWPSGMASILCISLRVAPGARFSVKWG
jgi:hypothetical protein